MVLTAETMSWDVMAGTEEVSLTVYWVVLISENMTFDVR